MIITNDKTFNIPIDKLGKSLLRENIEEFLEIIINELDSTGTFNKDEPINLIDFAIERFWENGSNTLLQNNSSCCIVLGPSGIEKSVLLKQKAIEIAESSKYKLDNFCCNIEDIKIPIYLECKDFEELDTKNNFKDSLINFIKKKKAFISNQSIFYPEFEKYFIELKNENFVIFANHLDRFETPTNTRFSEVFSFLNQNFKIIIACEETKWKTYRQSIIEFSENHTIYNLPKIDANERVLIKKKFFKNYEDYQSLEKLLDGKKELKDHFDTCPISILIYSCLLYSQGNIDENTELYEVWDQITKNLFNGEFRLEERYLPWLEDNENRDNKIITVTKLFDRIILELYEQNQHKSGTEFNNFNHQMWENAYENAVKIFEKEKIDNFKIERNSFFRILNDLCLIAPLNEDEFFFNKGHLSYFKQDETFENSSNYPEPDSFKNISYEELQKFYFERKWRATTLENEILEEIGGSQIRLIQAPLYFGKSGFLRYVFSKLDGYEKFILDLTEFTIDPKKTQNKDFYYWFFKKIISSSSLSYQNFQKQDYGYNDFKMPLNDLNNDLLRRKKSFVIFIDNLDHLRKKPKIAKEFCSFVAHFLKESSRTKCIKFVFSFSTGVVFQDKDFLNTWGNFPKETLPRFKLEETTEMAKKIGLNISSQHLGKLCDYVGGHPYLIHKFLHYLKKNKIEYSETSFGNILRDSETYKECFKSYHDRLDKYLKEYKKLKKVWVAFIERNETIDDREQRNLLERIEIINVEQVNSKVKVSVNGELHKNLR